MTWFHSSSCVYTLFHFSTCWKAIIVSQLLGWLLQSPSGILSRTGTSGLYVCFRFLFCVLFWWVGGFCGGEVVWFLLVFLRLILAHANLSYHWAICPALSFGNVWLVAEGTFGPISLRLGWNSEAIPLPSSVGITDSPVPPHPANFSFLRSFHIVSHNGQINVSTLADFW